MPTRCALLPGRPLIDAFLGLDSERKRSTTVTYFRGFSLHAFASCAGEIRVPTWMGILRRSSVRGACACNISVLSPNLKQITLSVSINGKAATRLNVQVQVGGEVVVPSTVCTTILPFSPPVPLLRSSSYIHRQ
jgi:hypothetical protein